MTAEPKIAQHDEPASSPLESSPELDLGPAAPDPPPQKRKGGRKPIYATSEERKQRNRQAQAAFRERRTEYIKHLEITIKQNEETLQALQQNSQTATDECSRLRYKIAVLERILADKGYDVDAELQATADSPLMSPLAGPGVHDGAHNLPQRPPHDVRAPIKGHGPGSNPKFDPVTDFARSPMSPKNSTQAQAKRGVQRGARPPQLDTSFQAESPLGSATTDFPSRGRLQRQSWPHQPHSALGNAFDTHHHSTSSPFEFGPNAGPNHDIRALTDYAATTSLNGGGSSRHPPYAGHGQIDGLGKLTHFFDPYNPHGTLFVLD